MKILTLEGPKQVPLLLPAYLTITLFPWTAIPCDHMRYVYHTEGDWFQQPLMKISLTSLQSLKAKLVPTLWRVDPKSCRNLEMGSQWGQKAEDIMRLNSSRQENVHRKVLQRGCGDRFKGINLLFLVFGIFAKINLRKHFRHLFFPSSCFFVCLPTLWKKGNRSSFVSSFLGAFAYPMLQFVTLGHQFPGSWAVLVLARLLSTKTQLTVDFRSFSNYLYFD